MDNEDFKVYSVEDDDITFYDFDEAGGYTTTVLEDVAGIHSVENGMVIENTTLAAEIEFTVKFFGVPIKVGKYHMVDVTNGG